MPDPTERQRRIVELLTSGSRMSLRRALRHAGYGYSHHSAWPQLLASPAIVSLFAEAIEAGRPLPLKHSDRILAAIANADAAALA
jgi:hypothetical protein